MKKNFAVLLFLSAVTVSSAAGTYEYKRDLREGARGKWINLRKHLSSGERLTKELQKVDRQIDKKVSEIQEIEELLFKIEKYKAENNIR
jgi:peptidoglycan hydrolase CwlO-like protein